MKYLVIGALVLAVGWLGPGVALGSDSGAEYVPGGGFPPVPDVRSDGSLTTIFASNNNFAGNSFDITATTDLTVVGFDVNLDTVVPLWTVRVWTRVGTADGFEQTENGWTMLGSVQVPGSGIDLPTHVDVGGLAIAAGQTYGVMISAEEAVSGVGGFMYTDGGPNTYSNADVSVRTYRGLSPEFPPLNVFYPRIWNGTLYYDYGIGTPVRETTWGSIKVGYGH